MNPPLRLHILLFTAARTVINTMHRMVYPFLGAFSRGLGVPLETLSLVLTARSLLGTAGPFLAVVADSRGRKLGLVLGLLLFTLGVGLPALWPGLPAFAAGLLLAIAGKYVFDPSMQAYLGDRVPYQRRGLVLAVTEFGWSLSFILGVPLAGWLIAGGGWAAPFPLLAGLGAVCLLAVWRLLPADAPHPEQRQSSAASLGLVFRSPAALSGLLVGLAASSANELLNLVFGVWMEDAFGLQIAALGAAAAVVGAAELGGEGLVGGLSDRLGKPRSVAFGLALNCLAGLALPLLGRSLPGALAGLFLFYLTFEFTLVSSIPMMTEILPGARATLMAANVAGLSLGRAFGALAALPLYSAGGVGLVVGGTLLLNFLGLAALRLHLQRFRHP